MKRILGIVDCAVIVASATKAVNAPTQAIASEGKWINKIVFSTDGRQLANQLLFAPGVSQSKIFRFFLGRTGVDCRIVNSQASGLR